MKAIDSDLTPEAFAELLCSEQLGPELGRVGSKFVSNMLVGIQRTRSVNLTEVAKGLKENIRLHATHKRLSRNLDDPELAANLSDRLLALGAATVQADTRLIVHLYELNKKYARKVEYLPDAGPDFGAGLKVCEIIAGDPESETDTPLLASVWSKEVPGFVSDVDEVKKALHCVLEATGNKGMMYFDDQSMDGDFLLQIIDEPDFNFITLMSDSQTEVFYRNEARPIQSLIETVETPYGRTMFKLIPEGASGVSKNTDVDLFMHAGALAIKLPNSSRNLRLIALKSKNRFVGEVAAPLITTETNLRSRKALMGLVESFLSMQDVLTAHQSLRDSFDPSSFRVLTYHRLRLLMTLLQGVMHYEVAMSGNATVSDHQFMPKPHDGDVNRTYFLPESKEDLNSKIQQASNDAK
ncbi:MAG: hypothetical protein ACR2QR_12895 [Woeseiaceae bacterium]